MTLLCFLLWWCHVVKVISEVSLTPPREVHVDNLLLTWSPTTEDKDATYNVEYQSFISDHWEVVPACAQTPSNSCNIALIKNKASYGCTALRVRAWRNGQTSRPAPACSTHADSCTPNVNLTARPGFLTVHLSRNNELASENGDHLKHSIYFGREGEPLELYRNVGSSMSIHDLQEGRRYCVSVEYVYFSRPIGLPSCAQCEVIPVSSTVMSIVGIVFAAGFALALVFFGAYILIFKLEIIKKWLELPYRIPEHFIPVETGSNIPSPAEITEEHFDTISIITAGK